MVDILIYAFIISAIGLSIKRVFFHKKKKNSCGGNCQGCQMHK